MNAIAKSIFEIRYRIPPEVLHVVFFRRQEYWRDTTAGIEDQLLSLVVRPRVLMDCNLLGGSEVWILLDGCGEPGESAYETVFHVPKKRTGGRSITTVLNVSFADPTRISSIGIAALNQANTMLQVGNAVVDAMGMVPITSTSRIELIGENVVLVRDVLTVPSNSYLRCIVANDENLNNIQLRSYHAFAKLVEYAVKSYIYNTYIVQLDIGELRGGQNLGKIKEIIDGYADAEQNYEDYLKEKWAKIAIMNDGERWLRMLRQQIGGPR
jgi:hypothetical protein